MCSLFCGLGGSQRLPRTVGFAMAKELIFTGRRVNGQQALELGLVNRTVPQNQRGDAAYREALNLAREILPQVDQTVKPKHMYTCSTPSPQKQPKSIFSFVLLHMQSNYKL